jgi:hypothetical protein
MKNEGLMNEKDISSILKSGSELPYLKNKVQRLIW